MPENFVGGMQRQVGWFVLAGLGSVLLLLLVLSVRSNVFAQKFYVYVSPPTVASFHEGQAVKFQGFTIGNIDQIELMEQGKVRITLRLLEKYRHMLHHDALVRLGKEGLIGETSAEITAGTASQPLLKEGDYVGYETEASIEQLLSDAKPALAHANVLLKELSELAVWMNDPNGDVRVSMKALREVSEGVREGDVQQAVTRFSGALGQLESLARSLEDKQVVGNLSQSLQKLTSLFEEVQPFARALGQQGEASVMQMNEMMAHVNRLSSALDVVASDLSELTPELPGLARESRATVKEMQQLVRGIRQSWLIGGKPADTQMKLEEEISSPVLDLRP